MDGRHAVILGVLVLGGVAWWQLGHPGYETPEQKHARVEKIEHDRTYGGGPTLYKWRDARGVLQVTNEPPKGRKYEEVQIRQDQNVIPMGGATQPTDNANNPGAKPPPKP
jgi:hypothetical protein